MMSLAHEGGSCSCEYSNSQFFENIGSKIFDPYIYWRIVIMPAWVVVMEVLLEGLNTLQK